MRQSHSTQHHVKRLAIALFVLVVGFAASAASAANLALKGTYIDSATSTVTFPNGTLTAVGSPVTASALIAAV